MPTHYERFRLFPVFAETESLVWEIVPGVVALNALLAIHFAVSVTLHPVSNRIHNPNRPSSVRHLASDRMQAKTTLRIPSLRTTPRFRSHRTGGLLLLVFLLLWGVASAQPIREWDRTYGGNGWEECQTMIRTSDFGYLFGGVTTTITPVADDDVTQASFGGNGIDYWIVKTDLTGNIEWQRRYGGDGVDRLWHMVEAEDGNFVLGGESQSGAGGTKSDGNRGAEDYWVLKVDQDNGNVIWDYTIGGAGTDILRGISTTKNGYILAGYSDSPAGFEKSPSVGFYGDWDYWMVEINEAGQILRQETYGGSGREQLFTFLRDDNDNYVLAGASTSGADGSKTSDQRGLKDWWIVKTDAFMNETWQATFGGEDEETPLDIFETLDGQYLLSGITSSELEGDLTGQFYGGGPSDVWLMKLEATTGNMVWQRVYGSDGKDWGYAVRENGRGKIVVAASSDGGANGSKQAPALGGEDFWLLYLDSDGSMIWNNHWQIDWGGALNDVPVKIVNAHDGGFVITGHSSSGAGVHKTEDSHGLNDFWIVKTNCQLEQPDVVNDTLLCSLSTLDIDLRQYTCGECEVNWSDGNVDALRTLGPVESTTYEFFITHQDGCEIQQEISITVLPSPRLERVDVQQRVCEESEVQPSIYVAETVSGTEPLLYSLNEGPFSDTTRFENLAPGTYELVVEDVVGCRHDTTLIIDPPQDLILDIGDNVTIGLGDSIRIDPQSNYVIDSFVWSRTDILSCSDCPFPFVRPLESTPIALHTWTAEGCFQTHGFWITVEERRAIFVPTAFSPNGDSENDRLVLYADNSVAEIRRFDVFDRWGQLLYRRTPFLPGNDPDGWDGLVRGLPAQTGSYVWQAEVHYIDGRSEILSGTVALLR